MNDTKIYKTSDAGPLSSHTWAYSLLLPTHLSTWDVWDYWERLRTEHIKKTLTKDSILIDVGAEQGALSALISKYITSKLILIEPSKEFWGTIKAIFEANHLVKPLGFFRGFVDSEDRLELTDITNDWCQENNVLDKGMPYRYIHKEQDKDSIPSRRIDTLVDMFNIIPNAINIDIEGAEFLAIKGAVGTITKNRPHIWISIHEDLMKRDYNTNPEELINFMKSLGYTPELLAVDHEAHYYFKP